MKSFFIRPLCLLLGILLLLQATARAEDARPNISDIFITTSQTHLLLFCSIKNGFTEEMIEGVKNGIPITFSFLVELERTVNNWFNSSLAKMTIQHTLSYDALKEQYRITLSERSGGPVVTESIDKAMAAMTELNGIKVINRDELEPDAPYALHVHATLAEKTLPLNMHYLVPFISLWDFETETRTIEFRY
ncbi:MAG TPA: DUF4390 domain-containing protein [Desulfobulbaceae bacterium]|nr:DUF4390 domain-containing protein [Desulfobulbaceae bacterium]